MITKKNKIKSLKNEYKKMNTHKLKNDLEKAWNFDLNVSNVQFNLETEKI